MSNVDKKTLEAFVYAAAVRRSPNPLVETIELTNEIRVCYRKAEQYFAAYIDVDGLVRKLKAGMSTLAILDAIAQEMEDWSPGKKSGINFTEAWVAAYPSQSDGAAERRQAALRNYRERTRQPEPEARVGYGVGIVRGPMHSINADAIAGPTFYDGLTLAALLALDEDYRREKHKRNKFTPAQQAALSAEWSRQLREKVRESDARDAHRERLQVVCDYQDDL